MNCYRVAVSIDSSRANSSRVWRPRPRRLTRGKRFRVLVTILVLSGCDGCVDDVPLDAGAPFDGMVLDLNGWWELMPTSSGDCPTDLLAHPFDGLTEWTVDGSVLRVEEVGSGGGLDLSATSPETFRHRARVESGSCFLEEDLQLEIESLEGRQMEARFEMSYSRAAGDSCAFGEDVPVSCSQVIRFFGFRR